MDKSSGPLLVGLTGGIGAGKSAVAQVWAGLGAHVVSADELARQVVEPGTDGLRQLSAEFGPAILTADASLDRSALASIVFGDANRRQRLEAITHPLIRQAARAFFGGLGPGQIGVYDMPLLVETGEADSFDVVVVVEAPLEQRLERLARRGLTRADALARIDSQVTDEERREVADVIIDNSGSVEMLQRDAIGVAARWGLPTHC